MPYAHLVAGRWGTPYTKCLSHTQASRELQVSLISSRYVSRLVVGLVLRVVSRLVLRVVVWHALCAHAEPVEQVVSLSCGKPRRFPPIAIPCCTLRQPAHRRGAGVCRESKREAQMRFGSRPSLPRGWARYS